MGNFDWNGFIDNLWERENAQGKRGVEGKGGYRNGKYYPYLTPNGNTDIGPGFDISHQSQEFKDRARKGFTKEELDSIVRDRLKDEMSYFNQKIANNGGDTTNIPSNVYAGLLDMYWQLGNGLYKEYPKFWKAVAKKDYAGMQEESKTYYDSKNGKKLDEGRWNFRKVNYFNGPTMRKVEKPTIDYTEYPDALRVANPYPTQVEARRIAPIMIPDEGSYVKAHPLTPTEDNYNKLKRFTEAVRQYNRIMEATSLQNNPTPQFISGFDFKDKAEGGFLQPRDAWDTLSLEEQAEMIKAAVSEGIFDLKEIRRKYNQFAEGGSKEEEEEVNTNSYSVGNLVNAIYQNNPKEKYLGEPEHHYDFTQSEEWANAHGYYPDARGHRDDRVKKLTHPSHPSRGTWNGDKFELTDFGMQNPNYTLFGLNDGGQDPQAVLTYQGGIVLPEITVTPKENYIFNPYDNIILHQKSEGGKIHIKPSHRGRLTELKKRTGKTEAELYRTGSPATRKMITFARNARKWKHGDGGFLLE